MKKLITRLSLLVALLLVPLACGKNDLLSLVEQEQEEQQTQPGDTDKQDGSKDDNSDKKDDDTPGEGEDGQGNGEGDTPGEGGGDEPGEGGGDEPGEGGGDEPGEGGGDEPDQPGEGGGDEPDTPGEGGGDEPEEPTTGPQLYNLNFDEWVTLDTPSGERWACYGEQATVDEKSIWATPNLLIATPAMWGFFPMKISDNCVKGDYDFKIQVPENKAAARIESVDQGGGVTSIPTPGALFTGLKYGSYPEAENNYKYDNIKRLRWGVEFTARPKALEGWFCYQPEVIEKDCDWKNTWDRAHLIVMLSDTQFNVNTDSSPDLYEVVDYEAEKGKHIIGYGKLEWNPESKMSEYERFHLEIEYYDNREPSYITIVATSSYKGDEMISAGGSTLWLDELELKY